MMKVQSKYTVSSLLLILLVVSLILQPILFGFRNLGSAVMFNFLAEDTMYYGLIANNYVKYGFPTADGVNISNGFQPFWGFLLMMIFKIFHIGLNNQLQTIFVTSIIFVTVSYSILALSLHKIFGAKPAAMAVLSFFPGIYFLFFEPPKASSPDPAFLYTLNPWSAINGMETPALLSLYSLLTFFVLNQCFRLHKLNQPLNLVEVFRWQSRICLLLIVFCRLEQLFFLVAIALVTLSSLIPGTLKEKIIQLFKVLLPCFIGLVLYMALNQWLVGAPLPTSGSGKIGAGLVGNLELVFSYFKNYGGDQQDRVIALLYCIFFGGLFLVFSFRKIINIKIISRSEYYLTTASLLVGAFLLLNSLFLFSLVPFWKQGYWYYFPMIFISAFLIACFIACIGRVFNSTGYILYYFALVLILNISFFNRLATQPPSKYALVTSVLWKQKNYIRNTLENYLGNFKIIDTYDGAFGYLLNVPTRSITGLVSSPSEILKNNDFWGNAIKDGFNVVPIAENSYIQPDFYKENNLAISNKVKFDGIPIEFYFIDKK